MGITLVGRKLLSERDENNWVTTGNIKKRACSSEGNYSLKEMRTEVRSHRICLLTQIVGRKLLSERDENTRPNRIEDTSIVSMSEGNYSLKEMRTVPAEAY